ncbi:MAK10-like protein [Tanacetum coccineum]
MGDENPIRTLGDYSKPSHEGYKNTIELLIGKNMVPLRSEDPNQHLKDFLKLVDSLDLDGENRERTRLRLFQFSLRDQASNWLERLPAGSITTWEDLTTQFVSQFFLPGRTAKLQDLALYDNKSWNDPRDFAKPVKAIALPQDVPSTSDRRLIELKNQVQRLMEAHLALTQPTQVNKITTSYEICSGPHHTQYCMEDPEQAFVEYASSRTYKAGEDDGEVMFIEIIRDDDEPQNECPNEGEGAQSEGTTVRITSDTFPHLEMEANLVISTLMLYLMRRSLEVLRKFHWMILGGRFNQLSHVSSPLLSKPREY